MNSRRITLPLPEKAEGFDTLMMIKGAFDPHEFSINIDAKTIEKMNSPKMAA